MKTLIYHFIDTNKTQKMYLSKKGDNYEWFTSHCICPVTFDNFEDSIMKVRFLEKEYKGIKFFTEEYSKQHLI